MPKSLFGLPEGSGDITLSVTAAVVRHPDGVLVFDTGHSDQAQSGEGYTIRPPPAPLAQQLAEIDVPVVSVGLIAFSHFHFDHVGRSNALTHAELLARKAELDVAFGPHAHETFGLMPHSYASLRSRPRRLITGDFDVFGDGRVILLSAPGHTPGSQALLVDLDDRGPVLLTGDLYHFEEMRTSQRVPPFNASEAETRASMARIEALATARQAEVWITHDPDQMARALAHPCIR